MYRINKQEALVKLLLTESNKLTLYQPSLSTIILQHNGNHKIIIKKHYRNSYKCPTYLIIKHQHVFPFTDKQHARNDRSTVQLVVIKNDECIVTTQMD